MLGTIVSVVGDSQGAAGGMKYNESIIVSPLERFCNHRFCDSPCLILISRRIWHILNVYSCLLEILECRTSDSEALRRLTEGMPQGVFSLTLFIIFMSDIMKDIPKWIPGITYADDVVTWCSEQYVPTAVRMQEDLKKIEDWL